MTKDEIIKSFLDRGFFPVQLPPGFKTRLISLKQAFKFVTEQQTSDDTT